MPPLTLARAAVRAHRNRDRAYEEAEAAISRYFGVGVAELTDSGTSALVMALRLASADAPVAMPGYACIDLIAAARYAGVPVVLYDLDPRTLAPVLESLAEALQRGARSAVVVHLFGYPVDIAAVRVLTNAHGAVLIEDAAQGMGGSIAGTPLGAHGDLGVLSFGRGKGANAAGGGALLANPEWRDKARRSSAALGSTGADWQSLAAAGAQWVLGRPSLYFLPLALPALRLGEMIYKPAHAPRRMAPTSAALVEGALERGASLAEGRRAVAARLALRFSALDIPVVTARDPATSGALRMPVILPEAMPDPVRLGALRPYPIALADHEAGSGTVLNAKDPLRGCRELARHLYTVPTHSRMSAGDEDRLARWVAGTRAGSRA